MSRYKAQTGNTPQSSLGEGTGARARPSKRLAAATRKATSTRYMQTTKKPSLNTSRSDNTERTTPDNTPTTPVITEKTRQHAMFMRIALKALLKEGLIKRYEVRSKVEPGSTTPPKVQRIRYEFDLSLWTEELELK